MRHLLSDKLGILTRFRGAALLFLVLALPFLLGAWKISTGPSINPKYVEHIENGKTKKHEILTWFGDPQEIKRLPEGVMFVYKTFRPKSDLTRRKSKEPKPRLSTVDSPYALEHNVLKRETVKEPPAKEPESTLIIRFKPDGETVQSHEYKEF